jgi:hypothetical protein
MMSIGKIERIRNFLLKTIEGVFQGQPKIPLSQEAVRLLRRWDLKDQAFLIILWPLSANYALRGLRALAAGAAFFAGVFFITGSL